MTEKPKVQSWIIMLNVIENGVLHKNPVFACGFQEYGMARQFVTRIQNTADEFMKELGDQAIVITQPESTSGIKHE